MKEYNNFSMQLLKWLIPNEMLRLSQVESV